MAQRKAKSPYVKYHKRPYRYSELIRQCFDACVHGRGEEYQELNRRARERQLAKWPPSNRHLFQCVVIQPVEALI